MWLAYDPRSFRQDMKTVVRCIKKNQYGIRQAQAVIETNSMYSRNMVGTTSAPCWLAPGASTCSGLHAAGSPRAQDTAPAGVQGSTRGTRALKYTTERLKM